MARPLVSEELWELIKPLIPKVPRRQRFPGRKRLDDRKVLSGILFVLQTPSTTAANSHQASCRDASGSRNR